jgi:hypothetical protein
LVFNRIKVCGQLAGSGWHHVLKLSWEVQTPKIRYTYNLRYTYDRQIPSGTVKLSTPILNFAAGNVMFKPGPLKYLGWCEDHVELNWILAYLFDVQTLGSFLYCDLVVIVY